MFYYELHFGLANMAISVLGLYKQTFFLFLKGLDSQCLKMFFLKM